LTPTVVPKVVNTEFPTENTELPTLNTELPTENTELPTENTELPTENTELPTVNTELPTVKDTADKINRRNFLLYRRKVAKKMGFEPRELGYLNSMDELELYCKTYLQKEYNLDINDKAVTVLLRCF